MIWPLRLCRWFLPFPNLHSLKKLQLIADDLTDDDIRTLSISVFPHLSSLQELDLQDNELDDDGFTIFASSFTLFSSLTSLPISSCEGLGCRGMVAIGSHLHQLRSLELFSVYHATMDEFSISALCSSFFQLPHLHELLLSDVINSSRASFIPFARTLISHCSSLTRLDLCDNSDLSSALITELANISAPASVSPFPNLISLDISTADFENRNFI